MEQDTQVENGRFGFPESIQSVRANRCTDVQHISHPVAVAMPWLSKARTSFGTMRILVM
jgi:hypothetical protein